MSAKIIDFLPAEWNPDHGIRGVLFQAFRVARADVELFSGIRPIMFGNVYIFPAVGNIDYIWMHHTTGFISDAGQITPPKPNFSRERTPHGNYLIFTTPVENTDGQSRESEAREDIKFSRGILMCHFGRTISFEMIFEQSINVITKDTAIYLSNLQNPFAYIEPCLDNETVELSGRIHDQINAMPDDVQKRVRLATRWLAEAMDTMKLDGFLKCWFAIETIGMRKANIRDVVQTLSRLYGVDYDTAKERFMIGRIVGLRSAIVHNGFVFDIDDGITIYMHEIFRDLLADLLGLPFRRRAETAIHTLRLNLEELLPRVRQS